MIKNIAGPKFGAVGLFLSLVLASYLRGEIFFTVVAPVFFFGFIFGTGYQGIHEEYQREKERERLKKFYDITPKKTS